MASLTPPPLLDPVALLTTALSAPESEQRGHLQRAKAVLELQPGQIQTIVGYILPFSTAPGLISDWMVEVSCAPRFGSAWGSGGGQLVKEEGREGRRKEEWRELTFPVPSPSSVKLVELAICRSNLSVDVKTQRVYLLSTLVHEFVSNVAPSLSSRRSISGHSRKPPSHGST